MIRRFLTPLLAAVLLVLSTPALAGPPVFTVETAVVGSGEVTLDPAREAYKRNNIVTVTAVPAAGSTFDHWEGDLAGDINPATLRVSGDHQVTAVFVADDGGGTDPPEPPVSRPPLPDEGLIVGYFVQWGIYRRDYVPADIVSSGTADQIDVINYAFAGIDENLRCVSLDPFADFEKRFDADETVDGVADTVAQPLKGNFNQLRKLKQDYPRIRILLSIGGWTESARFSDAALPENRVAFVESCIDTFIRGDVAPGVSAAGVFDGLDIDWEYPGSCGATCDFREEDTENFTALLAAFRTGLDEAEADLGQEFLLTIAAPAGAAAIQPIDVGSIHQYLDWINVMAYDFHGGWESHGPTNHHAHVFKSSFDGSGDTWGDQAIQTYLGAGVPRSKLLLGVPFYGRGWRGVSGGGDGLFQDARGVPRGTYEKGVEDYAVLAAAGSQSFWDQDAFAHWTFDGQEFWTFDDPTTLGWKVDYITAEGLRGAMFWEMSGDSSDGDLVGALREAFVAAP